MYKHILIGTDGSTIGSRALAHGLALAKMVGAHVTVVTATEPWSALDMVDEVHKHNPNPLQHFAEVASAAAKRVLDEAATHAKAAGVPCDTVHVPDRYAGVAIVETADRIGCDLIVMGSHGRRGIDRVLLGSQAYEVVSHTKIPTLIVR